ncbi:palmitoyl-(protein) hydrolase [Aureococcus anophagefferens]|nr:palmitoyl-(protein) hydrolase [Aureococcus anophagefferens]
MSDWSAAVLRRRSDLILLQTASGETTAAVHIVNRRRADSRPLTILYSHANAEDLGLSLPFADVLSRFCGCDVLAYEYLGYSISSGEPSEAGCLECVDAALAYLLDDCGLEPHRVVVYGRSIGSGPTVDVASRTSGLGGMILQSPIASAGHVVLPEQMAKALAGFDLFKNYEKIKDVTCRTLMIHGRADTMGQPTGAPGLSQEFGSGDRMEPSASSPSMRPNLTPSCDTLTPIFRSMP